MSTLEMMMMSSPPREPTTVRQRLAALPGYWINLDSSTERRRLFEERMLPFVPQLERVSAVDKYEEVSHEEAKAFHLRNVRRRNENSSHRFGHTLEAGARGHLAALRSHCLALRAGLEAGYPRFLVAEDDLIPRHNLLDVPLLGHNGHLMLYGSEGMEGTMKEYQRFSEQYGDGSRAYNFFEWRRIDNTRSALNGSRLYIHGTHLYEVSSYAAELMLAEFEKEGCSRSEAWWPVMRAVETWRAVPQVVHEDIALFRDRTETRFMEKRSGHKRSNRANGADGDPRSADGETEIEPGMRVRQLGLSTPGTVTRMDRTNTCYCLVLFDGETQAKVRSTRVLRILSDDTVATRGEMPGSEIRRMA